MKKEICLAGALASMTGIAVLGGCDKTSATSNLSSKKDITVVKCLGVAKAGYNGCGSTDGRHDCSGKATKNLDPTEWVYLPDGPLCENMGGKKWVKDGKVVKKQKPLKKFIGGDNV